MKNRYYIILSLAIILIVTSITYFFITRNRKEQSSSEGEESSAIEADDYSLFSHYYYGTSFELPYERYRIHQEFNNLHRVVYTIQFQTAEEDQFSGRDPWGEFYIAWSVYDLQEIDLGEYISKYNLVEDCKKADSLEIESENIVYQCFQNDWKEIIVFIIDNNDNIHSFSFNYLGYDHYKLDVDRAMDSIHISDVEKIQKLSEPSDTWLSLLDALKVEDTSLVEYLTSKEGYGDFEDIVKDSRMKQIGKGWSELDTRWNVIDDKRVELYLGPEIKEHQLVFIKTSKGWKIEEWNRGQ